MLKGAKEPHLLKNRMDTQALARSKSMTRQAMLPSRPLRNPRQIPFGIWEGFSRPCKAPEGSLWSVVSECMTVCRLYAHELTMCAVFCRRWHLRFTARKHP